MDKWDREKALKMDWDWYHYATHLPAIPIPLNGSPNAGQLLRGPCVLTGWSVTNTNTAAGSFALLNGEDGTGMTVINLQLAANTGSTQQAGTEGILFDIGIWAVPNNIFATGSVWAVPLWHYPQTPPAR